MVRIVVSYITSWRIRIKRSDLTTSKKQRS